MYADAQPSNAAGPGSGDAAGGHASDTAGDEDVVDAEIVDEEEPK